ncbi:hypothetical protein [Pseudomonas sp. RIT-PI-AD]|uniref:hypothetical protein n=1 Tax=Pseudomonas sp. RIT-PI-AD TaxID=3035294 RepID=UPI0021D8A104|nr:hypothetical protein [Pseudomonas sp. RIT-PI-AD]
MNMKSLVPFALTCFLAGPVFADVTTALPIPGSSAPGTGTLKDKQTRETPSKGEKVPPKVVHTPKKSDTHKTDTHKKASSSSKKKAEVRKPSNE